MPLDPDLSPREIELPADPAPVSTQTVHPWRATVRSVLFFLVPAILLLNGALAITVDELTKAGLDPSHLAFVWLNGALGALGVIIGIVNRIALLPALNEVLTRLGLGPTPPSGGE